MGEAAGPVSGRVNLVQSAGPHDRPLSAQTVCSWSSQNEPMPVAVIVGVDSKVPVNLQGSTPYAKELQILTQLSGTSQVGVESPPLGGVLKITFGLGAQLRVIEADIRAGSYQLPPCDSARFDAYLWGNGAADIELLGAIVPGVLPSSSRFTSSSKLHFQPGQTKTERVPFGARWVALAGGGPTGTGVGQPKLSLSQGNSSIFLLHDYQTATFLSQPGQPVELFTREDISITNGGDAEAYVTVRFFLEV